jgi:isopentenyl-diphosphate delta-isomerase
MSKRESHLVELVDDDGQATGVTTVAEAHDWPGQLHRAFSVLIVDSDNRVLLQRRAAVKTRFANRWGNACCGHPAPGEDLFVAAERRLGEELGLRFVALSPTGVYRYRAGDAQTGRVEHEYDHVLLGRIPADAVLLPDPAEVAELRWIAAPDLFTDVDNRPALYVPWLAGVLSVWHDNAATESLGGR